MTHVRLAYGGPTEALAGALGLPVTDIRLARAQPNRRGEAAISGEPMTTVQLSGALGGGAARHIPRKDDASMTDVRLVGSHVVEKCPQRFSAFREDRPYAVQQPALLVSFAYWRQFAAQRHRYRFRDYSLDSGAYTVKHSGGEVKLDVYIAFCQERLATDPQCAEVFALDVITDWRATQKNVEAMWKAGVPAIPAYHRGEPPELLRDYARSFGKIALGGCSQMRQVSEKLAWVQRCFAVAWPARIHGFAIMSPEILRSAPFHSVDASSWEMGPAAYGNYRSMGRAVKAPRGAKINLRAEVEWYLKLERELKQQWRRTLDTLEREHPHPWPPKAVAA